HRLKRPIEPYRKTVVPCARTADFADLVEFASEPGRSSGGRMDGVLDSPPFQFLVQMPSSRFPGAAPMLGTTLTLPEYFQRASQECGKVDSCSVELLAAEIHAAYEDGRFVFLCGNGGSAASASHLCEDLAKCTIERKDYLNPSRKRLKTLSLTDNTAAILAWGNDEGFER